MSRILLFCGLTIGLLATTPLLAAEPVTYTDSQGNVITFKLGASAFADRAVEYKTGDPAPDDDARDGALATGAPNYDKPGDGSYTTLGCGGSLVLQFTDNILVNQPGPDLHIFEVGPDIEPTFVAVSADGENWLDLGKIEGGRASLDIGEASKADETYRFVRLTDDGKGCRGRWPGADIDAVGALNAAQMIQLAGNLLFDSGSSTLRADVRQELERIAASLRESGVEKATIVGHTDAQGDATFNRELSLDRAQAVRDFLLVEVGLDNIKIEIKGAGESQPVADNDDAAGRKLNRRVEFIY